MALMSVFSRANVSFTNGKGSVLWDENGNDYIDFAAGIGVCSLGHANKIVHQAIKSQSKKLIHTSNLYEIPSQKLLSQKIDELLGREMFAFFCNSGAEANECAIKLARKYGATAFSQKKFEILTLANSFHGRTLATLQATGQDKFHPDYFAPYMDGFKFFADINEIIANIGDETVAVMIELVQGEGGIKPLDKQKVQNLAKILREKELLLITDEVQCGVFRTGEFATSMLYDIKPDIITFAKGLGGGVPIGACVSSRDIFSPGDHGSTFGGNQLVTTTACAILDALSALKSSGKLDEKITEFAKNLDHLAQKFDSLIQKRVGLGLMQGLVLRDETNLNKIWQKALENHLLILKSGKKTLRFLPALNIKKSAIAQGFARLEKTLNEI
jgi:acetylornithine transaminase